MKTCFIWIINHTDKKYSLLGTLDAEQKEEIVMLLNKFELNGHNIVIVPCDINISTNIQFNLPNDITEDYDFVAADDVISAYKLINIL